MLSEGELEKCRASFYKQQVSQEQRTFVTGQIFGTLWRRFFGNVWSSEVRRKLNTKVSTSLSSWYRNSIKLVIWLNLHTSVFDEGEDERFCQIEVYPGRELQLAK